MYSAYLEVVLADNLLHQLAQSLLKEQKVKKEK